MSIIRCAIATVRPIMWAGLATMLLLPVMAMRFTTAVKWDATDFLAAAILLAALGAAVELIVHFAAKAVTRTISIVGAFACALLVWADAAVGILE